MKENERKIEDIRVFALSLGFILEDGQKNSWVKKYKNHKNYEIHIYLEGPSIKDCWINFGEKIKIQRSTTCNFNQPENMVVLECVDRLLSKGYEPNKIILEKDWPLGHKGKGFLDILVLDDTNESFLMIECKTFGDEYRKEKANMFQDGGQLFSYLIQERPTKYLCLYSSHLIDSIIEYENDIVVVTDKIRNAKNQQEGFEAWNQIFENKGLFEDDIQPYLAKFGGILKKDLKELKAEDSRFIFNRFEEILRRNVVSDKTNAFNKIFNLFLCKIVDEYEHSEKEKLHFQWEDGETNEKVLLRLNDLYKKGMDIYLGLKIAAVTEEELEKELDKASTSINKGAIKELFIQQKLYTGNEFAFKEVFDKKSFEENSIVVKEVVKLLEKYRIKYSSKQQFLGDFFEKLLNTGIKQEVGQFFTPIPITRFICKSIPIEKIIEEKNNRKEDNFLPYVIDYASGSGHFLTEVMDEINHYVSKIGDEWIKGGGLARKMFNASRNEYLWAKEYVYGIEKDYRLAKTTKISTFLNGDGDANIICGDGLDNFLTSLEYSGRLKVSADGVNNKQFDIVIANPPYSVSGFKNSLKNGRGSFNLFDKVTDQSSEIECFFIERAKQLIRPGGYAGIILPISLLSNSGIYTTTRELLLKYFEVKAIVEFGGGTFMATGTNTVTLFLKRRDDEFSNKIEAVINKFFSDYSDVACNGIEDIFSQYVKTNYKDINFDQYISLLRGSVDIKIEKSDMYQEYNRVFENTSFAKKIRKSKSFNAVSIEEQNKEIKNNLIKFIQKTEMDKLLYFILSFKQEIVLVKSGTKDKEKRFLGYEFSNRRGHEGIRFYKETVLYDDENLINPNKVNTYILKSCLGEALTDVPEPLKDYVQFISLHELIDFGRSNFEKKISTAFKKDTIIKSRFSYSPLITLVNNHELDYISGLVYEKSDEVVQKTSKKVFTASNINLQTGRIDSSEDPIYLREDVKIDEEKLLKKNDIFMCTASGSISHLGKNCLISEDPKAYFGGFCGVFRSGNIDIISFLHLVLNTDEFRNYVESLRGQNINNLTKDYLLSYKIPMPEKFVIEEIIRDNNKLNKIEEDILKEISDLEKQVSKVLNSSMTGPLVPLGQLLTLEYGKGLPERDRLSGDFPVLGSNGVVGYHNESLIKGPAIIVGRKGSVGKINFVNSNCYPIDTTYYADFNKEKLKPRYVYYLLKHANLEVLNSGIGPGGLNREDAYKVQVPSLSIDKQNELLDKMRPLEERLANRSESLLKLKIERRENLNKHLL